jgi:hypothetical protein
MGPMSNKELEIKAAITKPSRLKLSTFDRMALNILRVVYHARDALVPRYNQHFLTKISQANGCVIFFLYFSLCKKKPRFAIRSSHGCLIKLLQAHRGLKLGGGVRVESSRIISRLDPPPPATPLHFKPLCSSTHKPVAYFPNHVVMHIKFSSLH